VPAQRVRAYIGLGANVGDAKATLTEAVRSLAALPGARIRGVSRLYATHPVGVTDQPDFCNAVVALDVDAGPDAATSALRLLTSLKDLERSFGRRRRRHWGPRELDLDLLVFGRARLAIERPPAARPLGAEAVPAVATAAMHAGGADMHNGATPQLLVVPHWSATERLFVLAPMADLAPGLVPPGWGRSVETARRRQLALEGPEAVRAIGEWDAAVRAWRQIGPVPPFQP
jgi:2-amino-4-hydroxy-6-hydroxymethyldihydropteridine diphosphokinase